VKKLPRSVFPQKHDSVDTLPKKLQTAKKETGSNPIVFVVGDILEKYRQTEERTEDERNRYLVRFILDNFQDLLKPYVDDFSKTVDLDLAVKNALLKRKVSDDETSRILKAIRKSVRKIKSDAAKRRYSEGADVESDGTTIDDIMSRKGDDVHRYIENLRKKDGGNNSTKINQYRQNCIRHSSVVRKSTDEGNGRDGKVNSLIT
jgi:hypothetical protein